MATDDRLGGKKTLKVNNILDDIEKDEVKKRVDIIALFTSFGVGLTQKGKGYVGLCPWHNDDKTPSLSVDRVKGLYNCFGCGESGDIVTLVEKMKGYTFREAMDYLRKEGDSGKYATPSLPVGIENLPAKQTKAEEKQDSTPPTKEVRLQKESTTEPPLPTLSLTTIAEYYHKKLITNSEALAYLKKRGFKDARLYSRYLIGYADGSLLSKVTSGQQEHLKTLGIIRASGSEHFAHCLTFPLYDEAGQVVGMYGRKIRDEEEIKHLYLSGGHKGLFNSKAAKVYEELILTESILDALSLLELGIENTIPLYGANGLTPFHLKCFKESRVKTLILALDNDEAGIAATNKLSERLLAEGFSVKTLKPAHFKDWNEELQQAESRETLTATLKLKISESPLLRPAPSKPQKDFSVQKQGGRYDFNLGPLTYRLVGVKEGFVANLKVNVLLKLDEKKYIDNLDLYSARSRSAFSFSVNRILGVEVERIEKDLLAIVEYLEAERDKQFASYALEPPPLSEEEKKLGLELLSDPAIFQRITSDMEALGYAGEELNKQLVYLAASSRKMDDPISVIILSESAAGKSYLIDTVKKLIPEEEVVAMTSLSDQALNYLPEDALLHKFLVMGEAVYSDTVEHQIREMLSSRELSRLVTLKDEKSGELKSRIIKKEVLVAAVMSSTNYQLNAENLSRCFLLNTDESAGQTKRIYELQRKKYSLTRHSEKEKLIPHIIRTHHAAQRLLTKRLIINPLAPYLSFPETLMRGRRDHERFLDLIASIAFLRQYQKEEQESTEGVKFIACDLSDYRLAYAIMQAILPATLSSFPKSATLLYENVRELLQRKAAEEKLSPVEVSLSQREIREKTSYNQMYVKRGLRLLCDYEYLKSGGVKGRGTKQTYSLLRDEPLSLIDLSMIPTPEEIESRLKEKSGSTGS